MALSKSDLKTAIEDILKKDPPSSSSDIFVDSLMDEYKTYAEDAEDVSEDKIAAPLSVSLATAALKPVLKILEKGLLGVPPNEVIIPNKDAATMLSTALGTALMSVWTGVSFGVTAPGFAGTAAFTASELLAVVSTPGLAPDAAIASLPPTKDTSKVAKVWADAMDKFTKSVQVTITGMVLVPGASPVPAPPITAPIT
jgi:hypothetical protein